MHLFVDISGHGLGHLALTAPVLNALAECLPGLRLTIRSRLPRERLARRILPPFDYIPGGSDFGFIMTDALQVDLAASRVAYQARWSGWNDQLAEERAFLQDLAPNHVFTNVSELPLAAAADLGIPASALCSLNWADLFHHYFGEESWAAPLHQSMVEAYRSARGFFRACPGMAMPLFDNLIPVGPIATLGTRHDLGLPGKTIAIAMGGVAHRLPVEQWPNHPGVTWLVPEDWQCTHPAALSQESLGLSFTDLLCSVDAVLTKPGYGIFTEAACNGTPVIYQRRENWPEQDALIPWLHDHGCALEVGVDEVRTGRLSSMLAWLEALPARPPRPVPSGAREVAAQLGNFLAGPTEQADERRPGHAYRIAGDR